MTKKLIVEELLAKAKKTAKLDTAYHRFYEGKVKVVPKYAIRGPYDFAMHVCIRC